MPPWTEPPLQKREILIDVGCGELAGGFGTITQQRRACRIDLAGALDGLTRELEARIANATVILVGTHASGGVPVDQTIRRIRSIAAFAAVPLFVCISLNALKDRSFLSLASAGADDFFCLDVAPDVEALRGAIRQRARLVQPLAALRALHAWLPSERRSTVVALGCVRHPFGCTVTHLARWFGVSRDTLDDWMKRDRLPSPAKLLRCGLLLHADALIEHRGVRHEEAARAVGLSDAKSLASRRRTLRRDPRVFAFLTAAGR